MGGVSQRLMPLPPTDVLRYCLVLHYPKMTDTKPTTITATMLQREVGTVLRRVGQQRQHIIVKRDGFPIVVIIPIVEYELWMRQRSVKT